MMIKKTFVLIIVLACMAAPSATKGSMLSQIIFHGFSSTFELVASSNAELLWLSKGGQDVRSLPCDKVHYTPGSDLLYFEVSGKLMATDFDQKTIMTVCNAPKSASITALGKWLLVSDDEFTKVFFDGRPTKTLQGAWRFGQSNNKIILLEGDGCIMLSRGGEILGQTSFGFVHKICKDFIVSFGDKPCLFSKDDLSFMCGLPAMGSLKVDSGYLIGELGGSKHLITYGKNLEPRKLPDFKFCFFTNSVLAGFDGKGDYSAFTLPELLPISLPHYSFNADYYGSRAYSKLVVVDLGGREDLVVDAKTAQPLFLTPRPSYAGGRSVFYQTSVGAFIHHANGELVLIEGSDVLKKALPVSCLGDRCTVLTEKGNGQTCLLRVNSQTGTVIKCVELGQWQQALIGTPIDYTQNMEVGTFESLNNQGFPHSSPAFINQITRIVTVCTPNTGEIAEYILPELFGN